MNDPLAKQIERQRAQPSTPEYRVDPTRIESSRQDPKKLTTLPFGGMRKTTGLMQIQIHGLKNEGERAPTSQGKRSRTVGIDIPKRQSGETEREVTY